MQTASELLSLAWQATPFIVSIFALVVSIKTYRDARAVSKLGLRPYLYVLTEFDSDPFKCSVTVGNTGPVAALQITLLLIHHEFYDNGMPGMSIGRAHPTTSIGTLDPFESKVNKLRWSGKGNNPGLSVREVRVTYRRESDLREYRDSAFYVLNKERMWTSIKRIDEAPGSPRPIISALDPWRDDVEPHYKGDI